MTRYNLIDYSQVVMFEDHELKLDKMWIWTNNDQIWLHVGLSNDKFEQCEIVMGRGATD